MIRFTFFITPHFPAKYYLFKDIKNILDRFHFKGELLDVGCGEKPYKILFKEVDSYIGIDFKNYSRNKGYKGEKPDLYFDKDYKLTLKLPFGNNSFDNVVSFQVLEHHKNPDMLIKEIVRIVRKNGLVLLSAPLIWGLHEEPNDYYRFTEYSLIEILKRYKCKILDIKRQGSLFSTISTLTTDYLIEIANKNRLSYILSIVMFPFFLGFSHICFLLDIIFRSKRVFLNYLLLAQKR